MLDDLSPKKIFDFYSSTAHKKFGQNFLFDPKINFRIVDSTGDLSGKIIAEIGPGPGGLTLEILKRNIKKLYIIELDLHWINVWNDLKPRFKGKLEVINCDALKFNMDLIHPDIIISNLPYNISTQLLFKWLSDFQKYEKLILMFQKEVGDRICAKNNTKSYGKLSILSQWKSEVHKLFEISSGSFFPAPKVKSLLLEFIPYKNLENADQLDLFSEMLSIIFSQRRKTVIKMLAKFFNDAEKILYDLGYDNNTRAEQISVEDYVKIFLIYKKHL